jgi:cell division topological specificity factor
MGFLNRLFGSRQPTSRQVAKERLQLVLVQDRINISPAMLETMKDELIKVISKYVEIDSGGVEVTFTQGKRQSRLVADIPVMGPAQHPPQKTEAGTKKPRSKVKAGGNA